MANITRKKQTRTLSFVQKTITIKNRFLRRFLSCLCTYSENRKRKIKTKTNHDEQISKMKTVFFFMTITSCKKNNTPVINDDDLNFNYAWNKMFVEDVLEHDDEILNMSIQSSFRDLKAYQLLLDLHWQLKGARKYE